MARYAQAFALPAGAGAAQCLDAREQAVLDARTALQLAATQMHAAVGTFGDSGLDEHHPCPQRLAAATGCLTAGHDLLQTHFTPGQHGSRVGSSPWAPFLTSFEASAALVEEISGYAGRLAAWALTISVACPGNRAFPRRARVSLSAACRTLRTAEAAAWAAGHHPAAANTRALLKSVPANTLPPRYPPHGDEPLFSLCTGAIDTAERLRHLAHRVTSHPRGLYIGMAASWQRTAQGAAIAGHCTELILQQLARSTAGGAGSGKALRRAADLPRHAWEAWRAVAREWDTFTTGPVTGLPPIAAEIGDLALRVGRIAHTGAGWTPARSGTSPVRPATSLASTPSMATNVVGALNHVLDALAHIAIHDRETVRTADTVGDLFLPARLLPPHDGPPCRYLPAPPNMTDALLTTYDTAIRASTCAAEALDNLTLTFTARPNPLAMLRSASRQVSPHLLHTVPLPAGKPAEQPRSGHIENALRKQGIHDPGILAHAAHLDNAAQELMAAATAPSHRQTSLHGVGRPMYQPKAATTEQRPSCLAAKDLPATADINFPASSPSLARHPAQQTTTTQARPRPGRR